jgi:mono/diheme cytochrome c family protein
MQRSLIAILLLAALPAAAETPQQLIAGYAGQAAGAQPGFTPSAERGRQFYQHRFAVSDKMPNCAACHTDKPSAQGTHAITGKAIPPLAPTANPDRLTSSAKVEKWFRRNCTEVVGRECTPAEKADFLKFLANGG